MKKCDLQQRLSRLETKAKSNAKPPPLFLVKFCHPNGTFGGAPCRSDHAKDLDGPEWRRKQGETPQDFERRVIASAPRHEHFGTVVIFSPTGEDAGLDDQNFGLDAAD